MARIRSIKPEFPQSESMGNVSRDARLTFIELWTLADDEGRLRGNSRMLASLLFPYDDDAPALIDTWLNELEREECIVRYKIGNQSYLQICNWLIHQKIDKPSKSKLPCPDDSSRTFANIRETSSEDQGRDQGKEGIKEEENPTAASVEAPVSPTSRGGQTFRCWLDGLKAKGERAVPEDDPVFEYAEDARMPSDFVALAWDEFKARFANEDKRYKDWRRVFRKAVRGNWGKLWWLDGGEYRLTSNGQQAMNARQARLSREQHREAA
ncbi:hypothetical protein ACDA63_07305 [Uliginosibacterium sp. sgz301328]|uniref:hypothetical protein n=1 Tax=Uliginosibacterium sp. sgz301328 TaxID=3243764 RepID=UPI00359E89B6